MLTSVIFSFYLYLMLLQSSSLISIAAVHSNITLFKINQKMILGSYSIYSIWSCKDAHTHINQFNSYKNRIIINMTFIYQFVYYIMLNNIFQTQDTGLVRVLCRLDPTYCSHGIIFPFTVILSANYHDYTKAPFIFGCSHQQKD